MTLSEIDGTDLRLAARRSYEIGRAEGALWRGAVAALFALPGFLVCNQTPLAGFCLAGFGLAVAAGRFRGQDYEDGTRAGAFAGIAPCLIPVVAQSLDPSVCAATVAGVPWPCALGGAVAGVILALRVGRTTGPVFWISAVIALGFAAALGCLPAGLMGFAALAAGLLAGAFPTLAARRADA
jgi:hypothetical protein